MGVKKIFIGHLRKNCIGCGSCVLLAPKTWKMNESDGKSDLISGKLERNGVVTALLNESDLEANKEAANACPVRVIRFE